MERKCVGVSSARPRAESSVGGRICSPASGTGWGEFLFYKVLTFSREAEGHPVVTALTLTPVLKADCRHEA